MRCDFKPCILAQFNQRVLIAPASVWIKCGYFPVALVLPMRRIPPCIQYLCDVGSRNKKSLLAGNLGFFISLSSYARTFP